MNTFKKYSGCNDFQKNKPVFNDNSDFSWTASQVNYDLSERFIQFFLSNRKFSVCRNTWIFCADSFINLTYIFPPICHQFYSPSEAIKPKDDKPILFTAWFDME